MKKIIKIANKIKIPVGKLELYGDYIAKVDLSLSKPKKRQGKLILVTAMTPTKKGEGKTTIAIGLADALTRLGKKTAVCLREPSLGPYFSQKGGAAGGGKATVEPEEEINLHFTGDIHAVSSAHNLVAATISNHIYWGNKLNIKEVWWQRVTDLCDRELRERCAITASSEIMAIISLAISEIDLKKRLGRIVIGKNNKNQPVKISDFPELVDKVVLLLKSALRPNLVQSQEGTPAFIHGGPFANIAHGTNSLIATRTALNLADCVVTEAGFGTELGAFKYFDLVARYNRLSVQAVVIVITTRAIKHYGLNNLGRHIEIITKLGARPIVVLNKFIADKPSEIKKIENYCLEKDLIFSSSNSYKQGSRRSMELARKTLAQLTPIKIKHVYKPSDTLEVKINKVNKEIFSGKNVQFSPRAKQKMKIFTSWGYSKLPICIAKTQYSVSDNKLKPNDINFQLKVTDLALSAGAGFVVVYCGNILTMPGMPKT